MNHLPLPQSSFFTSHPQGQKIQKWLNENNLQGFIVSLSDFNANTIFPSSKHLEWLTGFSGSAGTAIILPHKAAIFVDGRYTLQAREEMNASIFEIHNSTHISPENWIIKNLDKGKSLGFDPWLWNVRKAESLMKAIIQAEAKLIPIENNPMHKWVNNNERAPYTILVHPMKYAGESTSEKLEKITRILKEHKGTYLILTDPSSLAWTFNLRAPDTPFFPVFLGFAIIQKDKIPTIFIEKDRMPIETETYLKEYANLQHIEEFVTELIKISEEKQKIIFDPETSPKKLESIIRSHQENIITAQDPTLLLKSIKNPTEKEGSKRAHLCDGLALVRFLFWMDSQKIGSVDEIKTAKTLYEFREKAAQELNISFKGSSFETISAMGENAAFIHYHTSSKTNCFSRDGQVLLIDSGGQYENGTTDVTRTVSIGMPHKEVKERFTLVLKGLIALSRLRFPAGTRGCDIDVLARYSLWTHGLDYPHGTGHGVGSFLSVHEGPQKICKNGTQELRTGMILSNEPGYYKAGHYGIRCENLMIVKEEEKISGQDHAMHSFETLTLVPFDQKLIDVEILTQEEWTWINMYHKHVQKTLIPFLDTPTTEWLITATQALKNCSLY